MDRYQEKLRKPSFSSTLLDAIYGSKERAEKEQQTQRKKHSTSISQLAAADGFHNKLRRNNTGEVKGTEKAAFMRPKPIPTSSVGSSLAEMLNLQRKTQLPEIRIPDDRYHLSHLKKKKKKKKPEKEPFINKSADLKEKEDVRPKHPISPGGRLLSFFNSLFAAASSNAKKPNGSNPDGKIPKSHRRSPPPLSSCLCKTPSNSRGSSLKSVRFHPVSVVFDEDCRPCGEKRLDDERVRDRGRRRHHQPLMLAKEVSAAHLIEKTRRVEEEARELLRGYQRKSEFLGEVMRDLRQRVNGVGGDDDCDDGVLSCCSSSDLFELENLALVGKDDRYREEEKEDDLPLFETTRLDANLAIDDNSWFR